MAAFRRSIFNYLADFSGATRLKIANSKFLEAVEMRNICVRSLTTRSYLL